MSDNDKDIRNYAIASEAVAIDGNGNRVDLSPEEILRMSKQGKCTAHIILDPVTMRRFASVSAKTGEPVRNLIGAALSLFLKAAEKEFGLDLDNNGLN